MQSKVEKLKPTRVKINVLSTAQELATAKKVAVKNLGNKIKVPGFREGTAPEVLLEKYIEPNALGQETLEIAVNSLYGNAIINEQLRPVNNPEIRIKSFVPYESLEFEAEVDIIGDVNIGKYKGLAIKRDEVKVSAKEADEVLQRMRSQAATRNAVNRAIKDGDEAVIDFKGTDPSTKEPISGAEGHDYPLIIGSKTFIPGFEEKLIGLKQNETKNFDIKFPANYSVSTLKNKKVNFEVSIKQVNEMAMPKLDDNFAKLAGPFKTIEELRADIKKELKANKADEALYKQQNEIVDSIVKSSDVQIPEALIKEEVNRLEQEQRQNVAYRGQTWNEYLQAENLDDKKFKELAKEQSMQRIKLGLVLGAVANEENLSISDQELKLKVDELKQQYANDQKMQEELAKTENQQDIKNRLLVEKTVNRLVELNS